MTTWDWNRSSFDSDTGEPCVHVPPQQEIHADRRRRVENGKGREEAVVDGALLPDGSVEIKWGPSVYNLAEMRRDSYSLLALAPKLTMPTLILAVDTSPLLETHYTPIAAALPHSRLEVLPNYSHALYMEDPYLVARWAKEWLLGIGRH